MAVFNPVV